MRYLLAALAAITMVSCTVKEAPDSQASPVAQQSGAYEYCGISGPGISAEADISSLDPSNENEYCDSFIWGYDNITVASGYCDGFWDEVDADIVSFFMTVEGGDLTRSEAIGLVDAMWVKC